MHSLIAENVEEQKEENTNYVLSFEPAITTVNILTNFTKFWSTSFMIYPFDLFIPVSINI